MSAAAPLRVLLLGDELAFPQGGASTVYVRRMAQALLRAGAEPVVLCLDYSERERPPRNTAAEGAHRGVAFEYLTGSPVLPTRPWEILAGRARATAALDARIAARKAPGRTVALYYGRFASVLMRVHAHCAAQRVPLAASVVEWRLRFTGQTASQRAGDAVFHAWLARLDGAVVISRWIEDEIRRAVRADLPTLRVPLLTDATEWEGITAAPADAPFALLCADFDSYPDDARFVIEAVAKVPSLALSLVGKAERQREMILEHARRMGCADRVRLEDRFVPDAELRARYLAASALLAPLHDDDRSRARFPSKLADYLFAARPVVSCAVGEVAAYLRDEESAFLARPDDVDAFADALRRAVSHPDREAIAARGRAVADAHFDVSVQGPRMTAWFEDLLRRAS